MLRFVPVGAVAGVDGGRPASRGLPPAAFWGPGIGGERADSPKRDSQGMNPLSGCGQSPPFPLRDGRQNRACGRGGTLAFAGTKNCKTPRPLPRPPARLPTVPDGQSAPTPCSLPRQPKIRRATLKRFCPNGANSVNPAHWQRPLPLRGQGSVAKRTTLQTAGSCSRACRRLLPLPPQPKRNAAHPPSARGTGARLHGAEGTGCRRCLSLRGKQRRPAKQSAHRGRTAPSAVYHPRRSQKQPARVGTRAVKECRNRFQPPHFRTTISGRRHWLPWPGQQR